MVAFMRTLTGTGQIIRDINFMNALGLGLIAALCWGIHDITIRYLSSRVPLMAALLWVLLIGAVFQTCAVVFSEVSEPLNRNAIGLSIAAGIAFLTASLGLYYAFERGPVRLVAPVIASYPVFSIGFASLSGETITLFQSLAVLAIVAGVGLVAALSDDSAQDTPAIGPTIALSGLAALGFACTFQFGQMAADHGGEISTTLIARLTALTLLIALISLRRTTYWPGRKALLPLMIMGTLDGIALMSVIAASPLPNREYAAVASSTFGILTIVLAWAFLKERMSLPQWMGCLLTFAGISSLAL